MAGVSVIDAHPLRNQLIDMMMRSVSPKKIAEVAGISTQQVYAYSRKYVRPAIKPKLTTVNPTAKTSVLVAAQEKTRGELMVDISRENWLARVRKHEPLMDRAIEKAAEADNFAGVSSVSAARLKALELEAKATGILDERPVTNASFIMMHGEPVHQVIEAEYRYSSESDEDISTDTTE